MKPALPFLLAAALLLGTAADAERKLALKDALILARDHNKDLTAARARLEQSRVGIEQARVALLPTVSLQGKYTHNYKGAELPVTAFNQGVVGLAKTLQQANAAAPPAAQNPALGPALDAFQQQLSSASFGGLPSTIVIQKQEQLDSSIDARVPLVVPPAYANLDAANRTFRASEAGYEVTETDLLLSVAQAFYAAAGADELLVARRHSVEVNQQTLANSQHKLAAGTAKRTDVNQAALSLLRAQQSLLEAKDQRNQAYRALATLMQTNESFEVSTDTPEEQVPSTESLTQRALTSRPELKQYDFNALAYESQITAADWRWSPTLSAFGRGTLGNYSGFTGTPYTWAVGVQLDWTIYDGGNHEAQKHLAQAQLSEVRAKLSAEKDKIRDDVQTATENLATSKESVATSERSVALAKETLDLMRVQYDAGIATQLDVLQAQDSLVAAEVSLAQSHFTMALATLSLERNAGLFPESNL